MNAIHSNTTQHTASQHNTTQHNTTQQMTTTQNEKWASQHNTTHTHTHTHTLHRVTAIATAQKRVWTSRACVQCGVRENNTQQRHMENICESSGWWVRYKMTCNFVVSKENELKLFKINWNWFGWNHSYIVGLSTVICTFFRYVTGGYASRLYSGSSNCGAYACGDTDASAYRWAIRTCNDGVMWCVSGDVLWFRDKILLISKL